MFFVNFLDYLREDVVETFKNIFKFFGYKVILLKDIEKLILVKKEWFGDRWCFSGKMGGNVILVFICF